MGKIEEHRKMIEKSANYLRELATKIETGEIQPIEFSLTRDNPEQQFIDFTYYPPFYTFKMYYRDNTNV